MTVAVRVAPRSGPARRSCTVLLAGALAAMTGCVSLSPVARPSLVGGEASAPPRPAPDRRPAATALGPITFEANAGQADPAVRFMARGRSHVTFLTDDAAILVWRTASAAPDAMATTGRAETAAGLGEPVARAARLTLAGARPAARAEGEQALLGRVNYFMGDDPRAWRTGVATFGRVRYREVYPGIDLVWHGDRGRIEFDLVVAPGADPGRIRLRVDGGDPLAVDARGGLALAGGARLDPPEVYQDSPAGRQVVAGRYVLRGDREVAFEVGAHDPARPLVIDPIVILSTYLGGSGDETAVRFMADGAGNLYVGGSTTSFDFPVLGGLQRVLPGFRSCFVAKLDPNASTLLYSTYLGGSLDDRCFGMTVDGPGNVYLTGTASSLNFPRTAGALQFVFGGGGGDAFVSKIGPEGSQLLYSTFVGGNGNDIGRGIAIDGAGGVWIGGTTTSFDFPRKNAVQNAFQGGTDAFLTRIDTTKAGLASLVFSTYFGGSGADGGDFVSGILAADGGVAVDGAGNAFLTGSTTSIDLVVLAAIQPRFRGVTDAFVAKFGPGGALIFSTYLGGSAGDVTFGAATDTVGNVYVAGKTDSFDFPFFPFQGIGTAFVTKLDPSGGLVYSSRFGGSLDDTAQAIFVDVFGRAHVTGRTNSPDFPLSQPVQGFAGGGSDAFVTVLAPSGGLIEISSYLGGTGSDAGAGIFADRFGIIYVAGVTGSLDFPQVSPLAFGAPGLGGVTDAFLTRIASQLFVTAAVLPIARSIQSGTTATFFAAMAASGGGVAIGCQIQPVTPTPTNFLFQTTDPSTNALTGSPNTPVLIPAGGFQTFLIAFETGPAFGPTDIILNFSCLNTPPAQLIAGVNQPTLVASATPVPDIVALAATAGNDGILTLSTPAASAPGTEANAGAFSVATANLGAGAPIAVSADDNGAGLGLSLFVCHTDPATGICTAPAQPSVTVQIDAGQAPTFAIFAVADGGVPFEPAKNRVFARFRDENGVIRGATSVAVRTP